MSPYFFTPTGAPGPGQSHIVTAFIAEEKWKYDQARSVKKAQYKNQCYLKDNVLSLSPKQLLALQAEIKKLSKEFEAYKADWKGAKVRFIRLTKKFTSSAATPVHIEVTPVEASAQATEGIASTADEFQAVDETASTRAAEKIPASEETARATTSVAPEEIARPAEASTVVPEEIAYTRQLHQLCLKKQNQFPLLLLHLHQVQFFLLHQM